MAEGFPHLFKSIQHANAAKIWVESVRCLPLTLSPCPDKKKNTEQSAERRVPMPSAEEIQRELAAVENIDDFFGKEGVFARLFGETLTQMMQGELTAQLGYEPYEAAGTQFGQ